MTAQEMVKRHESSPARSEETRSPGRILVPAVDIFESEEELTLLADMPGVDKEGLEINLETGVLTISGIVKLENRGKSVLREFPSANYYRQFKLSEHIDGEKTHAELVNGVLTLKIPKAESAKPKRIEIRH
jgi:HSP20 family molecular chaperone IbpA